MRNVIILFLTLFLPLTALAQPSPAAAGYEVWVTNQQNDSIQIIDGLSLEIIAEVKLDKDGASATTKPHSIAFTPDGRYALTANIAAKAGIHNVSVIRTKDRKVIQTLSAGLAAHMVVVTPNGKRAFVANAGGSTVSEFLIDTKKGLFKPGRTIKILTKTGRAHPTCLSVTADSKLLFVTNSGPKADSAEKSGFISFVDIASGKETKRFSGLGSEVCAQGISPDGAWAYFTIGGKIGKYAMINIKSRNFTREETTVGKDPHGLAASRNGDQVWIANRLSNRLTVLETSSSRTVRKINDVGDKPDLIAFSPDGSRVFITLRGIPATPIPGDALGLEPGVSVIDAESGLVLKRIPIEGDPHGIAVRKSS